MLATLRLPDIEATYEQVVFKDSRGMTEEDRECILQATQRELLQLDVAVILHGTDTLAQAGELLHRELRGLSVPVILTGAMRPYGFRDTDALQHVTEALLAARLASPGVYVVMHNRVLRFPGVAKDPERLTFTNIASL